MKNTKLRQICLQNPNVEERRARRRARSRRCWLSCIQCPECRRQKPPAPAITPSPAPSARSADNPLLQCKYFHMSRSITSSARTLIFRVITPRDPHIRGPCDSRCLPYLTRRGPGLGTHRAGCLMRRWRQRWGPSQAASTHTACQSHSARCPPAMCTVFH